MFNYPVEKYTLRFYKYRLFGLEDKPIVIEAYNKIEARQKLTYLIQSNPELNGKIVVSEWLSLPIYGETTKTINGIKHVWVGGDIMWMPLDQFESYDY
jgi:hypothetical protein